MTEAASAMNAPRRSPGFWRLTWRQFRSNGRGMLGLSFVALIFFVSIFSPLIATNQPIVCKYEGRWYFPALYEIVQSRGDGPHWITKPAPFNKPQFDAKEVADEFEFAIWPIIPFHEYEQTTEFYAPPSSVHWLGTDELGRDVAARMVHGAAVAITVGFVAMGIATAIGITLGGLAGYFGGWTDVVISRFIEVVICFPTFFLILAIVVWYPPSIYNVMIVIGVTGWTSIARYTRGEFIRTKNLDYITAANALGIPHWRIMIRHILPNALTPVLVTVTFGIASAILIEAALSWLGFGVQAPSPSWGNMLRSAYDALRIAPHLVYPPCIAIFFAVLAYNLVGDALRDAIDPNLKKSAHL